ncbi:uncharacterized protein LOC113669318 [Pocillopora damicornis]|uniref:uncharacterized protein LOC113669318 n=1 Tax=Pocillopora damicornis TaxID=46731 RepID=UPI000F559113|nr:uncharacterized protein LOC113669318 [Pocillopora damicornis]
MEKSLMIASASALGASALTLLACRFLSKRREAHDNVYETEKLIGEYLIFHFGKPDELLPYGFGPHDSLDFPKRCALECIKHIGDNVPSIALDIGCAVGRSSFELAKRFDQVVGIDFSHGFINACNQLKTYGRLEYSVQTEGSLVSKHVAEVDLDIVSKSHCTMFVSVGFEKSHLNNVGVSTLRSKAEDCPLNKERHFVEFSLRNSLWLGGYKDADGKIVTGFDNLKSYLGPDFELIEDKLMPFLIRENACENQWSVAHATIWKRRQATP